MAEIVNLRRVKKTKARIEAAAGAAANRAKHGRTLEERGAEVMRAALQDRVLDGARIESARDEEGR